VWDSAGSQPPSAAGWPGTAIAWFVVVANLVAALRRVLSRPTVRRALDAVTGAILVALGLRLATTS
jgi:arginine exporter protein ArgO